jgi:D-glucosaminate-6-phosphate ammonia-lyase
MDRRRFFQWLSGLPLLGSLGCGTRRGARRDFWRELGIRPIINGAGSYTMFTGSLMRPEVLETIAATAGEYVRLVEVQQAVGKRIASLLGCEAAMVSSGAAAALTLGTAACITGKNPDFIQRIPDTTGMKNQVIIQKTHRFPYDHMVRNCGVRLVEVETREELEKAISPATALMLFLNKAEPQGQVKMEEFVAIGKKHGVPTFNDAAADVPPIEYLLKPIRLGFDLVTVSGGKGIRGPQSAGLLLGRKDLIEAALLNTAPHSDTMGRSCKVNKEEIVATMVALESFLKEDHQVNWREWERRVETIAKIVSAVPGVKSEPFIPQIANEVPHLRVDWDREEIRLTPQEVMQQLRDGEPSIELVPGPQAGVEIAAWTLKPGEAEVVGERLRAILAG